MAENEYGYDKDELIRAQQERQLGHPLDHPKGRKRPQAQVQERGVRRSGKQVDAPAEELISVGEE